MFRRRKPDEAPEPSVDQIFGTPSRPAEQPSQPAQSPVGVVPPRPVEGASPVLPNRPSPLKEPQTMSRPPVPTAPPPGNPSSAMVAPRPPGAPIAPAPRAAVQPAERRTLVVGRGISVQGSVQDAERLVVEGTVEATNIRAAELSVSPGGVVRGEIEVEEAELAGTLDGTLVTNGTLIVRATGKLMGSARCRRLQVEDGGQISGRLEMLTDQSPASTSAPSSGPRLAAVPSAAPPAPAGLPAEAAASS